MQFNGINMHTAYFVFKIHQLQDITHRSKVSIFYRSSSQRQLPEILACALYDNIIIILIIIINNN